MLMPFRRRRDLLEALFEGELVPEFFPHRTHPRFYGIRADIKENDDEFVIDAEIPGVMKEQITVDLKDNTLTISAVQKEEAVREGERCVVSLKPGLMSRAYALNALYVVWIQSNNLPYCIWTGLLR